MTTPRHIENFISNGTEVLRLSEIHRKLTGSAPGRRHNVEILNKSSVVLLVATWEALVEDLADAALAAIVDRCKEPEKLPLALRERVATGCQGMNAWKLAGTGWRKACQDNLKEALAKTTGKLNTPKTDQVNSLFERAVGLRDLSSAWHWRGMSVAAATKKLDNLITLRGSIAHRVQSSTVVRQTTVRDHESFLITLVILSSNRVRRHVKEHCGTYPWESYDLT